jgi:hypothetical protein
LVTCTSTLLLFEYPILVIIREVHIMWFSKKNPKGMDCDCAEINRRLVLLDREIQRLERQIARLEQQIVGQDDSVLK